MNITLDSDTRILTTRELDEIVRVHMSAFPKSALTKLGSEAVKRYYNWLLTGPHENYCIGEFRDDRLLGYCFGGKFKGALSGYLRKNYKYLALQVMTHPWLIANPLILDRIKLASNLLRKKKIGSKPQHLPIMKSFGILTIAVNPDEQRNGIGWKLMEAAEAEAGNKGFKRMNLSVEVNNEQAISFYKKFGWEKVVTQDHPWQGQMSKNLI